MNRVFFLKCVKVKKNDKWSENGILPLRLIVKRRQYD